MSARHIIRPLTRFTAGRALVAIAFGCLATMASPTPAAAIPMIETAVAPAAFPLPPAAYPGDPVPGNYTTTVNIRALPSTRAAIEGRGDPSTPANVHCWRPGIGARSGTWYYVSTPAQGYVRSDFVNPTATTQRCPPGV